MMTVSPAAKPWSVPGATTLGGQKAFHGWIFSAMEEGIWGL